MPTVVIWPANIVSVKAAATALMPIETAPKAIDLLFSGPQDEIKITFFGGEPPDGDFQFTNKLCDHTKKNIENAVYLFSWCEKYFGGKLQEKLKLHGIGDVVNWSS